MITITNILSFAESDLRDIRGISTLDDISLHVHYWIKFVKSFNFSIFQDQNLLAVFYRVQTVSYSDDSGLFQFVPHYIPNRLLCVWVNMRSWLVQDDDFTSL